MSKKKIFIALLTQICSACTKGELFESTNLKHDYETTEDLSFERRLKSVAKSEFGDFLELRNRSTVPEVESTEPIVVFFDLSRSGEAIKDTVAYLVNFVNSGSMVISGNRNVPLSTVALFENSRIDLKDTVNQPGLTMFLQLVSNYYYQAAGQMLIDRGKSTIDEVVNMPRSNMQQLVTELSLDNTGENNMLPYDPDLTTSTPWVTTKKEILLKVNWGQSKPYNLYAPLKSNTRCKAGCVAIAVAQLTSYHKLPNHHG